MEATIQSQMRYFASARKTMGLRAGLDSAGLGWTPMTTAGFRPACGCKKIVAPRKSVNRGPPHPSRSRPAPVAPKDRAPAAANMQPRAAPVAAQIGHRPWRKGLLLYCLIQARSQGLWPGSDPFLFSALCSAGDCRAAGDAGRVGRNRSAASGLVDWHHRLHRGDHRSLSGLAQSGPSRTPPLPPSSAPRRWW